MLRKWVKWCTKHKLTWVVYLALFCVLPLYLLDHIIQGFEYFTINFKNWVDEIDNIKKED